MGAAVLPLSDFFSDSVEGEREVHVWSPVPATNHNDGADGWHPALKDVLASEFGGYTKCSSLSSLKIRLVSFVGPDVDELIRVTPTLLHNISKTLKMGFSGAPTKPRSDIYITVKEPKLADGALFSHPERGFVPLSSGLDLHNLQLTLEIRKSDDSRVESCIFPSSDSTGLTAWRSVGIARGERWDQTLRLSIPVEDVPSSHMIMSVADSLGFPFALCWMPFWSNGAFIQDGAHFVTLHLYDRTTSNNDNGRGAYLDLPWDSKASKDNWRFESVAGPLATLSMQSFLCSTAFTQDQVLLAVLRWKDQTDSDLTVLLRQIVFVPEIEIVKLISEVLDSLFAILVDRAGLDEFEDLVFTALVTVLGIVHDRRSKLGPVVDEYADMRFNFPFATPCLIRSFLRLISRPTDYQLSRQLRATFKVGQQLIKFILVARKQQVSKEESIGVMNTQASFNRDFKAIFTALEAQMRDQSARAIGSRTLLVQHLHAWLPELRICFDAKEVVDTAISFMDACEEVEGKLILHKLVLLWNLLNDSRTVAGKVDPRLASRLPKWLKPYWGEVEEVNDQYREQVRLCCSILALLDGDYGVDVVEYYVNILKSYARIVQAPATASETFATLFPSTYPFQGKTGQSVDGFDEALTELATMKATVSAVDIVKHVDMSRPDLADLVLLALEVDRSILSNEAFPSSWMTLHVFQHKAIFSMLEGMSRVLLARFLPAPEDADTFNTEIWRQFLLGTLQLVRSDVLALETLPEQKRRAVWKVGGDIREKGAELLSTVWNTLGWETDAEEKELYGLDRLGGYQVQYVPGLVAPIVELCLSVHGGLRAVAVEIIQSMIISEWSLNEDLSIIQTEMVVCLDNLFKTKSVGDNAQQRVFIVELNDAFSHLEDTTDSALWHAIQELVGSLDVLLNLLMAVHTPGQDETRKTMHTLQLMEFLKGIQKEDIYISYVHRLANVETQDRNYKEAGLALRLHADLYSWNMNDVLPELTSPPFPQQSSFERKEHLFFEMIKHFEEGNAWEPALICYRELAERYEYASFDFVKLARTQRSMASIYELISRGESSTPRYFKVKYCGLGFPLNLRDKEYIFEGTSSERLANFTDRLLQLHPAARLISHGDDEVVVEGQYLQVIAMTPHRDLESPLYQRQKVSHSTKEFLSSLNTQRFSMTTRRHAPKSGVKDQWVEKTVYTTVDVFPTITRRSEIASSTTVSLSPLETALERTLRKSYELAILERRVSNGDDSSLFNLVEALRSSVNPSSSSSVAHYREILPSDKQEDRFLAPMEIALQTALVDFASTVKHSLALFAKSGNELEYRTLSLQFSETFAPELAMIAPQTQAPQGSQLPHDLLLKPYATARSATIDFESTRLLDEPTVHEDSLLSSSSEAQSKDRASTMPRGLDASVAPLQREYQSSDAKRIQSTVDAVRASEDTITTHNSSRAPRRKTHEDEARPITSHSVATSRSKKASGMRKRLSTMGMALGKKPSKGNLLEQQKEIQEE
jgi:dedicator of cytokinesis protein 3